MHREMTSGIKCYYQNTRGLRTKADECMANVVSTNFDIICLTETWLLEELSSASYFSSSYAVHRKDREYDATGQKFGGGVLIAVCDSLNSYRRQDLESYAECVWVEILSSDGFNYLVGNYYFPPLSDTQMFDNHLQTLEEQVDFTKYRVLIFGDFNLPGVDWASRLISSGSTQTTIKVSRLLNFINFSGLTQHNQLKNSAGNVLDLCLSNCPIDSITPVNDPLVRPDVFHPPFVVYFSFVKRTFHRHNSTTYCFGSGNYLGLYTYLRDYNWSTVLDDHCIDSATQSLTDITKHAINLFIPKRLSRPSKYPFWFSKELIHYMHKKEHFHKLFKRTGLELWYIKFSIYRALVKKLFKYDKRAYENNVESSLFREPDKIWRFVRQHTKEPTRVISLRHNNGYVTSPEKVANTFRTYFSECYSTDVFISAPSMSNVECNDTLTVNQVDTEEILEAIQKVKPKRSVGADSIPSFIVKGCAELFAPLLKHVFNLSLRTGVFPSLWKNSVVVPIHKSGDTSKVENYRPVSLLCAFSKVFEIVIHAHVSFYFSHKLATVQHGFVKGRSVETNLCSLLDYSVPIIVTRGQVDIVYFDLSKAFDKVNHKLLLYKLSLYGVSSTLLEWFNSYLSERQNRVRVSSCLSDVLVPSSGVPQGSNLGPLLFLVYISDIATCVKNAQMLLFADDIKIFMRIQSEDDCALLQNDVSRVSDWCFDNFLLINPDKTKQLTMCRKREIISYPYLLCNSTIQRVLQIRDLGVYFDSNLSFSHHVSQIVASALRVMGMISRLTRDFSNHWCVVRLFCSLVRVRLEFCSVVWNSLNSSDAAQIERVQKRFIRIVYDRYFGRRCFYDYDYILKDLLLQNLLNRRIARDVLFLHKVVHGRVDSELVSSLKFHVPARVVRGLSIFYPSIQSKLSPLVRMQICGNDLSSHVDIFSDISVFRRELNFYLFNS